MNFEETDVNSLIYNSKSRSTRTKTTSDVKYFKEFLVQIRGCDQEPKTLDEDALTKYLV